MTVATKERVKTVFAATIGRDDLLTVVKRVQGVIERRSTIPILCNVKLETRGGRLRVTATDLDMEATDSAPCVGEGATTVNAEQLGGLLAKMPNGAECSLAVGGAETRLVLKCGPSNYRLNALPVSDFPAMSETGLAESVDLDAAGLETLIDKTAFAMCVEATRYYLCGARLHLVGTGSARKLRMVATDTHRLALAEMDAPPSFGAGAVTIPSKTIREIGRLVGSADETVSLRIGSQKIQVSGGTWTLTSKVLDGDYPPYERVIPAENKRTATLDRLALAEALDRLRTIAPDLSRAVRMELSEGHMHISLRTLDGVEGDEEVEADFTGSPIDIGFNAAFLLDVLGRIEAPSVELRLADPGAGKSRLSTSPSLILDPSNPHVQYVLMSLVT